MSDLREAAERLRIDYYEYEIGATSSDKRERDIALLVAEHPADEKTECRWSFDETHGKYDTACGKAFFFEVDGIAENGFKFCPYCGIKLKEPANE